VAGDSVHSGVVTHTTEGALTADSASVSGSAQLNGVFVDVVTTSGAPGPARRIQRYVVFIDGKRYIGTEQEIRELIEEFAEKQAEKAITQAKVKKPRIVVEAGKTVSKPSESPQVVKAEVKAEAIAMQAQIRQDYEREYQRALAMIELQDEEDLIALL
jgi:uncharacterized membrane protein (UPF0182 family)